MLQSLLLSPLLLPNPENFLIIVPITEVPRQEPAPTPLTFREKGGVLLKDLQATHPALSVEVIPEAVPGPR